MYIRRDAKPKICQEQKQKGTKKTIFDLRRISTGFQSHGENQKPHTKSHRSSPPRPRRPHNNSTLTATTKYTYKIYRLLHTRPKLQPNDDVFTECYECYIGADIPTQLLRMLRDIPAKCYQKCGGMTNIPTHDSATTASGQTSPHSGYKCCTARTTPRSCYREPQGRQKKGL